MMMCRTAPLTHWLMTLLQQAQVLLAGGYATHADMIVARACKLGLAVLADIEWSIGPTTERLMGLSDRLVLPFGVVNLLPERHGAGETM